jgi:hypothetical protein
MTNINVIRAMSNRELLSAYREANEHRRNESFAEYKALGNESWYMQSMRFEVEILNRMKSNLGRMEDVTI